MKWESRRIREGLRKVEKFKGKLPWNPQMVISKRLLRWVLGKLRK